MEREQNAPILYDKENNERERREALCGGNSVILFRERYCLPTAADYTALLSSRDHENLGRRLVEREQDGVAKMRSDGFAGSTLAEAYDWWRGLAAPCDSQPCTQGGTSCGGTGCGHSHGS